MKTTWANTAQHVYTPRKEKRVCVDIWELHVVGVINSGQWPLWKLYAKYNSDGRLHSMKVRVHQDLNNPLFFCFLIILLTCSDGIKKPQTKDKRLKPVGLSGPLHLTQAVGQGTAHTPLCFARRDGIKLCAASNFC